MSDFKFLARSLNIMRIRLLTYESHWLDVLALHFKIVQIPKPIVSLTLPSLVWIPLYTPRENTPSASVSEYSYFAMQHSGLSSLLQTFNYNERKNWFLEICNLKKAGVDYQKLHFSSFFWANGIWIYSSTESKNLLHFVKGSFQSC